MINVLIVEDSPVAQEFLTYILTTDPDIRIMGIANNGNEALEIVKKKKPDVITMDIHMPIMDGYEATRRIMETAPAPIVIVSGSTGVTEVSSTFRAFEAGALAVVLRPPGLHHERFRAASEELIQTVKLMSEVRVVRRIPALRKKSPPAVLPQPGTAETGRDIQVAAIGASTGGPAVLLEILSSLPGDLPFPVLIVQHITMGFCKGFVDWLREASRFPVKIADDGERPAAGQAYVAPDGCHMGVTEGPKILLSSHPPEHGLRPSVSFLFRTVTRVYGRSAVGVLLTGMGKDGAEELKMLRDAGAVAVAQDSESSIVHGMPGEAIKIGAADHVLPPEKIAALLAVICSKSSEVCDG